MVLGGEEEEEEGGGGRWDWLQGGRIGGKAAVESDGGAVEFQGFGGAEFVDEGALNARGGDVVAELLTHPCVRVLGD